MSEDEPSAEVESPAETPPIPAPENADPALRGDAAVKTILLRLLEAMETNQDGVLRNEDPECLHDFRISVRRTRSALGQIKGVFPETILRRFVPRFARLGQVTSQPRDFDVYLLGFDGLKANLPTAFRESIEPLRGFLERHADLAHAELARQLHNRSYGKLLADWHQFLTAPCPKRPTAPQALMPIRAIADAHIWRLFRRVLKEGRRIRPDTPAGHIHELRKTCKKLRYLLEFFRALYPPDEINRPIKQLKKLQDYLGDFQDVHARIDMLRRVSPEMRLDRQVPTEALLALGVLLATLDHQQSTLRKAFPEHFEPFAKAGNRIRFRGLFKPAQEEE